jgi:hypothetical protein
MKYLITWLMAMSLTVQAQTQTTPNLINPAGTAWGIPASQVLNIAGISAVEGAGYTTGSAYYNSETNTIRFGYLPSTVSQIIAINTALQGSGIQLNGFNWRYEWMNGGSSSGSLGVAILLGDHAGNVLESQTMSHAPQAEAMWNLEQGTKTFTNPYTLNTAGYLGMAFSGQDDRFWMGLYGPRVRDPRLSLNYSFDQCAANPLSSPTCPNYATAYFTQQCTISALYNPACPGYAAAYFTQQCTANALYNPACPGYAEAYLAYQCNLDGLYSQSCPNYSQAYAKKNILNIPGTSTTTTNTSTSTPITTVKSDGTVNTEVSRTGVSTVDAAISTPSSTSTTSVTSVTSTVSPVAQSSGPVSATAPSGTASSQPAQTQSGPSQQAQETRKGDSETRSSAGGASNNATAKANVEARAKEVAKSATEARTFEAQAATQSLVVGLMGFVPGFDVYGSARITDVNAQQMARLYNRPNVDNRQALRRLTGASDRLHTEMVDQQYQLGK